MNNFTSSLLRNCNHRTFGVFSHGDLVQIISFLCTDSDDESGEQKDSKAGTKSELRSD